jgi:hypothetical protein
MSWLIVGISIRFALRVLGTEWDVTEYRFHVKYVS